MSKLTLPQALLGDPEGQKSKAEGAKPKAANPAPDTGQPEGTPLASGELPELLEEMVESQPDLATPPPAPSEPAAPAPAPTAAPQPLPAPAPAAEPPQPKPGQFKAVLAALGMGAALVVGLLIARGTPQPQGASNAPTAQRPVQPTPPAPVRDITNPLSVFQ